VDGIATEVRRADVVFRGVFVPDGDHLVRMEFRPLILPLSLGVILLTAIALVAIVLQAEPRY
jgi:hypothetical protein